MSHQRQKHVFYHRNLRGPPPMPTFHREIASLKGWRVGRVLYPLDSHDFPAELTFSTCSSIQHGTLPLIPIPSNFGGAKEPVSKSRISIPPKTFKVQPFNRDDFKLPHSSSKASLAALKPKSDSVWSRRKHNQLEDWCSASGVP